MKTVNIHEAKTHLSRLVDEASEGRGCVIAKAGKPVAKLIPISTARRRKPGYLKGRIKIAADFEAALSEDERKIFESGA